MQSLSEFPAAARFTETAQAFCTLVETAALTERRVFFEDCFRLAARLVSEVVQLPKVEGELDTMRAEVTDESYRAVVQDLKQIVGDRDSYRMVFDPWNESEDAMYGSVSDDLADTWRDIKRGLAALSAGSPNNAICDWSFSFQCRWGPHHLTHVLRPLFTFVFDNEFVNSR
jgi:hypothetical protein